MNKQSLSIMCFCLILCFGCSNQRKTEVSEPQNSVQKAYGRTTDALRNVVESVDKAVY